MDGQITPETQVQNTGQVKCREGDEPVTFDPEFIRERAERESSHDGKWMRCVRYVKACYLWRLKLCCGIMTVLGFFC